MQTKIAERVVVAQKGAREHYAVARALYENGLLAGLVTDWYSRKPTGWVEQLLRNHGGQSVRRALGRQAQGLPSEFVRSWGFRSILWDLVSRLVSCNGAPHAKHLVADRAFASWVSRLNLPDHGVFFGYSYASLEALHMEKNRGVFTILDQIDAAQIHDRLVRQEAKKWPDYADMPLPVPVAYYHRVRQEWKMADLVVVNSEWTRSALLEQGVPSDKISVIPLAYSLPHRRRDFSLDIVPPLRVLWVGTVHIGKGIQYLVEAARTLVGEQVTFTVAGGIAIKPDAVNSAPENITWLGQIPRTEVLELYRNHHIFVLPTISDGFAITQLEALSHGLPVIVTPNCARVVEDSKTGFVIAPFSAEALAEAIRHFIVDPSLINHMAVKAVEAAMRYSVETYASRLIGLIGSRWI